MNTRHPAVIALAAVLGVAFIVLAIVYWAEPAGSLPVVGFRAMRPARVTTTSSTGSPRSCVGVALLIFAWFQTGDRGRPKPCSLRRDRSPRRSRISQAIVLGLLQGVR